MQNLVEKIRAAMTDRKAFKKSVSDKGAGFVEYGAVILLVAAIAGVVLTQTGIPTRINGFIDQAITSVQTAGEPEEEGDGDGDGNE
ncbi:hypothetical protein ACFO4E_02385 [Nocardiopsis mangrovi]|uniref:Flp family type IVb pilin n=1 Tax=Nocardiopsis mangrovi TaxID=1179818 RepID=A0ABV9DP69_9ACTN